MEKGTEKLSENFALVEFNCHDGTGVPFEFLKNVKELAENLQVLRDAIGEPIHINSGYRTPKYNASLQGASPHSQHMLAKAGDITAKNYSPRQLRDTIEKLIKAGKMKQGGLGLYRGFTHYDVRGVKARWDYTKIKN